MHDPLVVAFDIRWPIPRRVRPTFRKIPRGKRWYMSKSYLQIGQRAWRLPTLITIWHKEPGGHDALSVCGPYSRWRWHIQHWRIQVPPLQELRRRVLTRCTWCAGRHTKAAPVNVSHSWEGPRSRWWQSEIGLYHMHCSSVVGAKRQCLCDQPDTADGSAYGECRTCGKRRYGPIKPEYLVVRRLYATVPDGTAPSGKLLDQVRLAAAR